MSDKRVSSGAVWEDRVGYSRALRRGEHVYVAGTLGLLPGGDIAGGAYDQTRRALKIIGRALNDAGSSLEHVTRTRMYILDFADSDDVGRAHLEVFRRIRPAATMVAVSGLAHPAALIEVEVEALIPEDAR